MFGRGKGISVCAKKQSEHHCKSLGEGEKTKVVHSARGPRGKRGKRGVAGKGSYNYRCQRAGRGKAL